jgi:hypothetical protein
MHDRAVRPFFAINLLAAESVGNERDQAESAFRE